MKCLSLKQPFATLVMIGAKRIETRSWPTGHRGPLAIHASRNCDPAHRALCEREPFQAVLEAARRGTWERLALGQVIGTVEVTGCRPVEELDVDPASDEAAFGDFRPGRWGWELANPAGVLLPLFCREQRGLFEVPDAMIGEGPAVRGVIVRHAGRDDVPGIFAVEKSCFGEVRFTAPNLERFLGCPEVIVLVAEERGRIVGLIIYAEPFDRSRIFNLLVLPGHRRRGIASRLLRALLRRVGMHIVEAITDERSTDLQLFLKKHGFQAVEVIRGGRGTRDAYRLEYEPPVFPEGHPEPDRPFVLFDPEAPSR